MANVERIYYPLFAAGKSFDQSTGSLKLGGYKGSTEKRNCEPLYLPPHSPNPISSKEAFSREKKLPQSSEVCV